MKNVGLVHRLYIEGTGNQLYRLDPSTNSSQKAGWSLGVRLASNLTMLLFVFDYAKVASSCAT